MSIRTNKQQLFIDWGRKPTVKSQVQNMSEQQRVAHFHKLYRGSDINRARQLAREYR